MISKRLKNNEYRIEHKLKKIAIEKMESNGDGFYLESFGGKKQNKLRTLDKNEMAKMVKRIGFENIILHWRLATTGKKTKDNVQGWKVGDWQFVHNGIVDGYITDKNQDWSDSWYLFNVLASKIQNQNAITDMDIVSVINGVMTTINFWGRYALYNTATDKLYLVGDWYVYLLNESNLVLSSASLKFVGNKEKIQNGFVFNVEQDFLASEKEIDGIGVISHWSTQNFEYQYLNTLHSHYISAGMYGGWDDEAMDERAVQQMTDYYDSLHTKPVNELRDFEEWRECCELGLCSREEY